ncbi:MAG: HlyD family efflux transporter periplasmic adaptor subunit, partial [Rheinheimera sp.]
QLVNPRLQRLLEEQELMLQSAQAEQLQVLQQLTQEELQLKHELLLAQGERKLLAAQLSAKQQLFEQQIVSALDFAQSEVLLEQAEQKLLLAGEKLQGFSSAKQSRLQAAELQLQRAQKQLDIAKQDVQSLQVAADVTGQLIALDETLKPGSRVEMGQALGQVAVPDVLIAELKITAVDAAAVKINQRVQVNIKGKRMPGKVSWISPNVIDNFMRLDVTLEGELPDTARANIEVSADITAAEFAPSLLSGRPSYVKTAHRRYPLFIKDPARDVFVRRDVDIGEITSRQMQLGAGVVLGEQILLVVPAALLERTEIKPEDLDG